jgi:hypothetical protein
MDSGSSKCGGVASGSRPLGPSGEPCMELLLVISWEVCGDMIGEACCELEATEEALMADSGTVEEGIVGREFVWS